MKLKLLTVCCLLLISTASYAVDEKNDDMPVLSTIDIVNMLIKEGVISQQRADELVQIIATDKSAKKIQKSKAAVSQETPLNTKVVRVPYVPEYIQNQIRDEVRLGLREDVANDVIGQAKHERWGVPDALPSWVNKISFKGDFRLRYQGDYFADGNSTQENIYIDAQAVNEAGTINSDPSFFHNITESRQRLRARMRLAMNAKVTEGVAVGMRISTGNLNDPVSINQTMGNSLKPYQLVLDRAFIKMESEIKNHTFIGGRMPNPWVSTDLLWDKDLNFDGVVYKYRPLQSDDMFDEDRVFDTYLTFGAFPLDEVELSSSDKWLMGFQSGLNWSFDNQNKLDIVLSYYDYRNIEGSRNSPESNLLDYTAPDLLATGNTLHNISNSINSNDVLLALAADYNIVDMLIRYKIANFAPVNIVLTMDYVENIGYDQQDVLARAGGAGLLAIYYADNEEAGAQKNTGYQFKLDVGWPTLKQRGNWRGSLAYKYLERDAVLDIYTDSDFRGGGTDVQGFILQGDYAVDDNTWISAKLISADEIDGPPFGQDTIQIDLNASF